MKSLVIMHIKMCNKLVISKMCNKLVISKCISKIYNKPPPNIKNVIYNL